MSVNKDNDNMVVSVIVSAEVITTVSQEVAGKLRGLKGVAQGEGAAMELAKESNDLMRLINELKAHGADAVWLKRVALLGRERDVKAAG